jgi:hypothetical protein
VPSLGGSLSLIVLRRPVQTGLITDSLDRVDS